MMNMRGRNNSAPDPFSQALMMFDAEFGPDIAGAGPEPGIAPSLALDSMAGAQASPDAFNDGAANTLVAYSPNPVREASAGTDRMMPNNPLGAGAMVATNSMTAGAWPYAAAGMRKITGHDEGKGFETLRREEQMRVEGARNTLGNLAMPVEMMTPMGGAGLIMRGAKSVGQAARRGAAAGSAYGATRGYLEQIEPDTFDVAERVPPALMGGAAGAGFGYALGAAGKAIADRVGGMGGIPRPGSKAARASAAPSASSAPAISTGDRRAALARGQRATAYAGEPVEALPEGARNMRISDLYRRGLDLQGIADDLGEPAEALARTVLRSRDMYMPEGHRLDKGGLVGEAENVLRDVAAYRQTLKPQPQPKAKPAISATAASPAPAPKAEPKAEPREAKPRKLARQHPGGEYSRMVDQLTPEQRDIARQEFMQMQYDRGAKTEFQGRDLSDADILRGWRRWQSRNDTQPRSQRGRAGSFKGNE